jgi:hypothetical protein
MLQSVLLASIVKGQFPIAVGGIVLVVMLLKMRSTDVGQFAFRLLDAAERGAVFGYVLCLVISCAWVMQVRYLKRQFRQEIDRVIAERNAMQARVLGNRI